jgi:hypothetical protein
VREVACRLADRNDSHAVLRCADDRNYTLLREQARAPAWVAEHARTQRRRCQQASPPPAFRSPRGMPIPAASSVGLHARVSAERFLASDLARTLCAPPQGTGALNCSRAPDAWRAGAFLATLLRDPAELFAAEAGSSPRELLAEAPPDDAALWERDWVACVRGPSGAIEECAGRVPRETWLDPARRDAACAAAIAEHGQRQLSFDLQICDLDAQTDALCEELAGAERDVEVRPLPCCHAACLARCG